MMRKIIEILYGIMPILSCQQEGSSYILVMGEIKRNPLMIFDILSIICKIITWWLNSCDRICQINPILGMIAPLLGYYSYYAFLKLDENGTSIDFYYPFVILTMMLLRE